MSGRSGERYRVACPQLERPRRVRGPAPAEPPAPAPQALPARAPGQLDLRPTGTLAIHSFVRSSRLVPLDAAHIRQPAKDRIIRTLDSASSFADRCLLGIRLDIHSSHLYRRFNTRLFFHSVVSAC